MKKCLPRRTFLKYVLSSWIVGFSTSEGNLSYAAIASGIGPKLNGALSYQLFAALVGQTFKLAIVDTNQNYTVRMLLTEIVAVSLTPENDQFYLVFQVLNSKVQPNGVYRIRHATAGSTKLLLQPMGNGMAGNFCRADFNLLL